MPEIVNYFFGCLSQNHLLPIKELRVVMRKARVFLTGGGKSQL